jgi:hypothetical protein
MGRIKDISAQIKDKSIEFLIKYRKSDLPEVEMHTAKREISALEKAFGLSVVFKTEST